MAAQSALGAEDLKRMEEFFGFYPCRFIDDVANTSVDYTADAIDEIEEVLTADDKVRKVRGHKELIHKGCDEVYTQLKGILDENFDKFEIYLGRNVFAVPLEMDLLPKMSLESKYTAEDEAAVQKRLDELRQQIAVQEAVQAEQSAEQEMITQFLSSAQEYEGQFANVERSLEKHSVKCLAGAVHDVSERSILLARQVEDISKAAAALADKENHAGPEQRVPLNFRRAHVKLGAPSIQAMQAWNV
mmetsp:Transcript_65696/g.155182  ORF Transcript_65696/g.155182 Transcript_65696/m.155182 type:complete len:245 (+) Transcript_65696:2-736(+)